MGFTNDNYETGETETYDAYGNYIKSYPTLGGIGSTTTANTIGGLDIGSLPSLGIATQGYTPYTQTNQLSDLQMKNLNLQNQQLENAMAKTASFENSFMGKASPYIKGFTGITQGLGSIANIYAGFKQLGMMEDQLDIAKEQWSETKSELGRIKGVRNRLNTQYMA